jgi:hypothetical protein
MLNENIFKKYINNFFIETGSYIGDGIQYAIEAGFKNIYSIELSDKYYNICKERYKNNENIHLIKGDTCDVLFDLIKDINEPITFWLDGHNSGGDTALGKYNNPLIQELEQIKQHHIKTHTIIIDDMNCWTDFNMYGFIKCDIVNKVMEINNNYNISYEYVAKEDDILVATIKNNNK